MYGAQGQRLFGATVRIKKAESEIMWKLTDKDGKVEVELPSANYSIEAYYGPFVDSTAVFLTKYEIKMISLDIFLELLGVGMSMANFLLFIVMSGTDTLS
ncbi:MAG: hypothetical protein QXO15_05515 [Nitrososphaerota archaeon]